MDSVLKIYAPIIEEACVTILKHYKYQDSPLLMAQIISGYFKLKDFPLILMINFKKEEIPVINEEIKRQQLGNFEIKQITKETTQQRSMTYISSGVYSLTNVILVMDLLQKALSGSIVTAIIINKAETIEGIMDQESWITNMIRRENKDLRVLAISDSIEMIHSSQNFRKIMMSLYLDYCSLWPLSRYEILKDVSDNPDFETFETVISLPKPIKRIQKALMTLIRTCLDEINHRYKNKNNGEPILLENDIFNTGLRILTRKMRGIMERFNLLGNKLFQDVFGFRSLLYDVIHLDAIEFYIKVIRQRVNAGSESIWCYGDQKTLECIEELLKISKQRVFNLRRRFLVEEDEVDEDDEEKDLEENQGSSQKKKKKQQPSMDENEASAQKSTGATENSNITPEKPQIKSDWIINPIEFEKETFDFNAKLDINFKYKTLIDVLKTYQIAEPDPNKPRTVLWINTSDEFIAKKIKTIINGFFSKKDEMKIQQIFRLKTLIELIRGPAQPQPSNNANSQSNTVRSQTNKSTKKSDTSIEIQAEGHILDKLLVELTRLKKDYEKNMMIKVLVSNGADSMALDEALEGLEERHKLEEGGDRKPLVGLSKTFPEETKENNNSNAGNKRKHSELPTDLFEGIDDLFVPTRRVEEKEFDYKLIDKSKLPLDSFDDISDEGEVVFDPLQVPGLQILITSIKLTHEKMEFVSKNNPNILLLFEPDLNMIRETIVMKRCAKYGGMPCNISKIHILMVQNSIESAVYLDYIQRENNAFVAILKERSNLPKFDDDPESRIKKIVPKKYESTRKGRGAGFDIVIGSRPVIIVDKREFNSPLPARLYHDGFWVIPVLLEKGDYILSNSLVVERKSVETGDLLNSIRSGRLETQLNNMCKAFNRPILLIEFSETIDFNLEAAEISKPQQNHNWYSGIKGELQEVNRSNVKFYLAWLCMKFPKLTILWSKSTEFTSKFFQRVKAENPEPELKLFAKFQEDAESKGDVDPALANLDERNNSNFNSNALLRFLTK